MNNETHISIDGEWKSLLTSLIDDQLLLLLLLLRQ